MTPEQVERAKADREAQSEANKHWRPTLAGWRAALADRDRRAEAEKSLAGVTDPRAVPSVWKVFGLGNEADQRRAVQLLGQIASPDSSRALVMLAVFSASADVRRSATETLRNRDPRESVGYLIGMIREPIKYEVKPVGGPGSPGALFVEGQRVNGLRLYSPPSMPVYTPRPGDWISYDGNGLPVVTRIVGYEHHIVSNAATQFTTDQYMGKAPIADPAKAQILSQAQTSPNNSPAEVYQRMIDAERSNGIGRRGGVQVDRIVTEHYVDKVQIPIGRMMLEARRSAVVVQEQLAEDVATLDAANAAVARANEPVLGALGNLTGQSLGADREAWRAWWVDQQGYAYQPAAPTPRPTVVQQVPLAYQPPPVPIVGAAQYNGETTSIGASVHHNCFGAGTLVKTLTGPKPVESIAPGDRVLTQDTEEGALSYQPVLRIFHNKPSRTLRIRFEGSGEEVVATLIHRFWVAGRGWVMARDLKEGDEIRSLAGRARVARVEPDKVQPVFNLEVAENGSFLVGAAGLLVHDNSLVEPAPHPFDAPAPVGE